MIFSSDVKLLYTNKEGDYIVSPIQCIDMVNKCYYIKSKNKSNEDVILTFMSTSDVVLKECIMNTKYLKCQYNDDFPIHLYTGDIVEIKKGKRSNLYEIIVSGGKIKGREINTSICLDIEKLLNDIRAEVSLTNKHFNKERKMIEYQLYNK